MNTVRKGSKACQPLKHCRKTPNQSEFGIFCAKKDRNMIFSDPSEGVKNKVKVW